MTKKETEKRNEKIRKYGIEIVKYDEELWNSRGYAIDYISGLLVTKK